MKKKLITLGIILFCSLSLYADNDLSKLEEIGISYYNSDNLEAAIRAFKKGLFEAKKQADQYYEAVFYGNLGMTELTRGNLNEAREYHLLSLEIGKAINDHGIVATNTLNLGIIYKKRGINDQAFEFLFKASRLLDKLIKSETDVTIRKQYEEDLASALNSLGNLCAERELYKPAMAHFRKSLTLRESCSHTRGIATSLNYIGNLFLKQEMYDSALFYLKKSLALKIILNDKKLIANSLVNIGVIYDSLRSFQKSENYYAQALDIRRANKDKEGLVSSYSAFGLLCLQKEDFTRAIQFIDSSQFLASELDLLPFMLLNYDLKRKVFRKTNQKDSALVYDDHYFLLNSLLFNKDKNEKIAKMQIEYDIDEKEKELVFTNHLTQAEKRKGQIIMIIACFFLLLLLIGYPLYLKNKKEKEKNVWLMKELNHRVKNNLQVLYDTGGTQLEEIKDPNLHEILKENRQRVTAMMLIHQELYRESHYTMINLKDFIEKLLDELLYLYAYSSKNIHIRKQIDVEMLDADRAILFGLIINEVLTNSFKYAFPGNPNPALSISCIYKNKAFSLIIADNGKTYQPKSGNSKESFGFKLIETLCQQLNATYNFEFNEGMIFTMKG